MGGEAMRRYWDDRAREDAFYFVDNELAYGNPDRERFWTRGAQALDLLLEAVGVALTSEDRVVEIGCGIGRMTRAIASRVAFVEALDVSERMLELAREHNPELANVSWLLGDGESLSGVADASVDVCVSHVVFQHLPHPSLALGYVGEIGRVLGDRGWAALQVSNAPRVHSRRPAGERLEGALRAALGRGPRGQDHPAWRGSAIDLAELGEAAGAAGMEVERVAGAGTQFCIVLLRQS